MNSPLVVKTQNKAPRRRQQRQGRQRAQAGKATVRIIPVKQRAQKHKKVGRRRVRKSQQQFSRVGLVGIGNTAGRSGTRNSMIISDTEFVAPVIVANQPNFNNTAYALNPGNAVLFPWLSTIAKQFEKYTFTRLNFIYKKEVSEYATGGQTGKVIMSVDFDAADPAPGTKQQMEDTIPHADAMPSQSFALNLQTRDLAHPNTIARYVRSGGLPGGGDIKTYDVGNLNVATQGILTNSEVGELHVSYTVKLEKPVLESGLAPANNQVSRFVAGTETQPTSGTPYQMLFADVTPADGYLNPLGVVNTAGSFVPPAGNYIVYTQINIVTPGLATRYTIQLLKNGAAPVAAGYVSDLYFTSGSVTAATLSVRLFVSANGTDNFEVQLVNTFSTGASDASGVIEFQTI